MTYRRRSYTLTWTDCTATNVAPDTDIEIDCRNAILIIVQMDATHTNNTCNDFDVNVMSSLDGNTWDTVPYAERNIADGEVKTFLVEPGPEKIRLRGDSNDSNSAYITARVHIIEEH